MSLGYFFSLVITGNKHSIPKLFVMLLFKRQQRCSRKTNKAHQEQGHHKGGTGTYKGMRTSVNRGKTWKNSPYSNSVEAVYIFGSNNA